MLKENPDIESYDDDPAQVKAKERLRAVEGRAREKDMALIALMRKELFGRPSIQ